MITLKQKPITETIEWVTQSLKAHAKTMDCPLKIQDLVACVNVFVPASVTPFCIGWVQCDEREPHLILVDTAFEEYKEYHDCLRMWALLNQIPMRANPYEDPYDTPYK